MVPTIRAAGTRIPSYNSHQVIAQDVRFFATSTGDALTPPYYLYYGQRFRSYGVSSGRYSALYRGSVWHPGWVTGDSRYVTRVPDEWCP